MFRYLLSSIIYGFFLSSLSASCEYKDGTGSDFSPNFAGRKFESCMLHNVSGYKVVPAEDLPDGTQDYKYNHWGLRPSGQEGKIQALVMHYTASNAKSAFATFCNSGAQVSAHYVITETEEDSGVIGGMATQLVPEDKRAWHAGKAQWRDLPHQKFLNDCSIGIENVNKGFTIKEDKSREWYPFDKDQIKTLGLLSQGIIAKYGIDPTCIVAHGDITPGVKSDPGVLFPWGELYSKYSVGAWLTPAELAQEKIENKASKEPLPKGVSEEFFFTELKKYGYSTDGAIDAKSGWPMLYSFRCHFSANQCIDELDNPQVTEKDMLWAYLLNTKYPR
jgi:N-acetylmuramoyl-L-alanine amidase